MSRRWRLVLGQSTEEDLGPLSGRDAQMDRALQALYESDRAGGLGSSSPHVSRWLGDIRQFFPASTVRVMQADALERLELKQMLFEPEMLASLEPDVHLVATLLALKNVIPARTKETARMVVRKVVDELEKRLRDRTVSAVRGSLSRATRTRRPRASEIDWDRTIKKNLHTWRPETKRLIAETLVGHGHKRHGLRDIVLLVDQSGSMASSVVYSSIFGAALASVPALRTRMVVFDTSVVDLSENLADPVDLLFGTQLGGGTDIDRALAWCTKNIERPAQTILVLISDLFEGGDNNRMLSRAAELVGQGVTMVALLALADQGAPSFDEKNASKLAALGIPSFACTPDLFPELMAAAIEKRDMNAWAASHGINATR